MMQSVVPETRNVVTLHIGRFTIRAYGRGVFWIENEIGEGMTVTEIRLNELLASFWKENF
jgi:hypothetical protein